VTLFLAFACGPADIDADTATDTDAATGGIETTVGANPAPYCEEVSSRPPSEPDVASDGFTVSANEFLAGVSGGFEGTSTFGVDASAAIAATGAVEEVRSVLVDPGEPGGGTTGPAVTAPSVTSVATCAPFYRVAAEVMVTAAGGPDVVLDEVVSVSITGVPDQAPGWAATIPLEDLVGTVRPSFDPAEWDRVELTLSGTHDGDALRIDVMFSASNATAVLGGPATSTSTATAEPGGMVDMAGSLDLVRVGVL
jgi:hypothetical protein